jgi:hypothetical protein
MKNMRRAKVVARQSEGRHEAPLGRAHKQHSVGGGETDDRGQNPTLRDDREANGGQRGGIAVLEPWPTLHASPALALHVPA